MNRTNERAPTAQDARRQYKNLAEEAIDKYGLEQTLEMISEICSSKSVGEVSKMRRKRKSQKAPVAPFEPKAWQCPVCGKVYPTYALAKCCREIPIPTEAGQ